VIAARPPAIAEVSAAPRTPPPALLASAVGGGDARAAADAPLTAAFAAAPAVTQGHEPGNEFSAMLTPSCGADSFGVHTSSALTRAGRVAERTPVAEPPEELPGQMLGLLSGHWTLPAATAAPMAGKVDTLPSSALAPPRTRVPGDGSAATLATPALPTLPVTPAASSLPGVPAMPATPVVTSAKPAAFESLGDGAGPVPPSSVGLSAGRPPAPAAEAALLAAASGSAASAETGVAAAGTGIAIVITEREGLLLAGSTSLPEAVRPSLSMPATPLAMPANPEAGFDDGFGARVAWMAEQRVGHVQIRLNPEHVGPIEVHVQLDGDQVNAEFHSAKADVRHAIEASLPRLRELLDQHGLHLGQADVGQGRRGKADQGAPGNPGQQGTEPAADEPRPDLPSWRRRHGLLNEYA